MRPKSMGYNLNKLSNIIVEGFTTKSRLFPFCWSNERASRKRPSRRRVLSRKEASPPRLSTLEAQGHLFVFPQIPEFWAKYWVSTSSLDLEARGHFMLSPQIGIRPSPSSDLQISYPKAIICVLPTPRLLELGSWGRPMYSSKYGVPLSLSTELCPRRSNGPSNAQINDKEAVRRLEWGGPPKAVRKYASTQWSPPVSNQVSVGFFPSFNLRAFFIPVVMTSVDLHPRHRCDNPSPPTYKMCCAFAEGWRSTPKGFLLPRIWPWSLGQGVF